MKKTKMHFSKKVCLYSLVLVALVLAANFVLAWFDKMPLDNITVAVIGTYGAFATGGYFALAGYRDGSKNKNGFHPNYTRENTTTENEEEQANG
ncbi:hypothetical protein FACS18949_15240 [Clostridia bacterium]|nr:hypothetical protein FACS189425_08760 [Clostridia bacterium]GHV36167.1 hypothetical protein FACS18949_15240 [Clostridia bacterium]